jgi:hypothetical protein
MKLRSALLTAAILISVMGRNASGYALQNRAWPAGIITLQMELGPLNKTLQDGSPSWNAAAAPAATAWNQQLGTVQLVTVMDSSLPVSSGDKINTVSFANTVFGDSFGGGTLAVTYYRYVGSTMSEADVLFNSAQKFDSYRGPLQFQSTGASLNDIRRVLIHELGHALGLNHPDSAGQHVTAIMNAVESDVEGLTADDIAGGQSLYGAPLIPTPTPTPTPAPSPTATPAPTPSSTPPSNPGAHLVNISTRMRVGVGNDVLIGGFIIQGSEPKKLILRAIGPSLANGGIADPLANPVLELHDSTGDLVGSNDDWQTSAQVDEIVASTVAPSNPLESAIVATLAPGAYTAIVRGLDNTTGIALVEGYELDSNASRLVNLSTRGQVGVATEALIGGFIVRGSAAKRTIIRALGPSLGSGPNAISNALSDPYIELRDGSGNLLAANDNWSTSAQAAEILDSTLAPPDQAEAALVATLPPGTYTAVVRGADGGTGVGLIEVYDLD